MIAYMYELQKAFEYYCSEALIAQTHTVCNVCSMYNLSLIGKLTQKCRRRHLCSSIDWAAESLSLYFAGPQRILIFIFVFAECRIGEV